MSYLPSTLAAAIMIHIIKEIEPLNATEYQNQLPGLLKTSEVCHFSFNCSNLPRILLANWKILVAICYRNK